MRMKSFRIKFMLNIRYLNYFYCNTSYISFILYTFLYFYTFMQNILHLGKIKIYYTLQKFFDFYKRK